MNIVRFAEPVTISFKKSAGGTTSVFEAGRDYILAGQQLERITQDENVRNRLYKVSRLEPRLAPFTPQARKNGSQRVLFYNGSGGYGDAILSWPVAKFLADQGYEVHVLTDPGNQCCWYGFPWVKTIQVLPLAYELFKMFDYHFVMENVNNLDEHQDQLHPVDAMFHRMGVDPKSVDPAKKVVAPVYTWAEQQVPKQVFTDKKAIGIFQLTSANSVRAMLPNDTAFMLFKIAEAFPEIHWLAAYDEFNSKTYPDALKCRECKGERQIPNTGQVPPDAEGKAPGAIPCPECKGSGCLAPNIQPYTSPNLRDLWALTHFRASVVVAPDSMMVHVAGCQNVPCVGIWGPVSPTNRVLYYRAHHGVFHKEACPHAPCFAYLASFPKYCPPRGAGPREVCEVTSAVTPTEVIDAIRRIKR